MERYYIVIPDEFYDEMSCLDDAEYGSLIRAGQRYAIAGEPSEVTGNARFFLKRMCNTVDHYVKKMEETSARRSAAGKKGGRPKKQIKQEKNKEKNKNENKKEDEKQKQKEGEEKSGVPPSQSEVEAYCQEAGLQFDAAKFFDYYSSRGWLIDGQVIADWRATARNWARHERGTPAPPLEQANYTAPDAAEVERMRRLREQLRRDREGDSTI